MNEKTQKRVVQVEELRKQGMSVEQALKKANISPNTYYAHRNKVKKTKTVRATPKVMQLSLPEMNNSLIILAGTETSVLTALDKLKSLGG